MRMSQSLLQNELANILIVAGAMFLVFSATITFKFNLPEWNINGEDINLENIIYYRGVLLGSIFIISGSAVVLIKNMLVSSFLFSLASGNLCLIITSSLNLIFDELIDLDKYFDYTMITVITTLFIVLIIRLWLVQILTFVIKIKELLEQIIRRAWKQLLALLNL